ncbi:MAG: hypothetical protein MI757_19240 [Pirellulales bacterium]|nr:hypothetical protein [Pirellulales bacterium]
MTYRRTYTLVTFFSFTLALLGTSAPLYADEPLRVLFIGNSYTYGHKIPDLVVRIARASKVREISQRSVTGGGMTLEAHWKDGRAVERIKNGKWDVVILQEQSMRPVVDPSGMNKYGRMLDAEIGKADAKTMFFLTWARQKRPEMQDKLNESYGSLAEELEASVAPVGQAWRAALAARPELKLHARDGSHASPHGAYLAACVFYSALTGKSAEGSPVLIQGVNKSDVAFLQKTAWKAVETWSQRKSSRDALHPKARP